MCWTRGFVPCSGFFALASRWSRDRETSAPPTRDDAMSAPILLFKDLISKVILLSKRSWNVLL